MKLKLTILLERFTPVTDFMNWRAKMGLHIPVDVCADVHCFV